MDQNCLILNIKSIFRRFWWLILIVIILVLVLLFYLISKSQPDNAKPNNIKATATPSPNLNCPPKFTYEFVDFTKIDAFQPIGSITGASRGRSYITVTEGETVAVYAPMDATLISVIYAYRGPNEDHGEYGFKFTTECNVAFLLDHLDSASDELKQYAPAEPSSSTATSDNLSIPIKGGTLLGYTNGTSQARTFDFLVIDRNIDIFHINPERWEWEQSLYSVCPYDLYTDDLKTKYYEKIGTHTDNGFVKAESCGNISYDIPNTISGGWFLDEDATDLKGEFMLIGSVGDRVDIVVKNDSESINLRLTDYDAEILPQNVGITQSVCYEGYSNDWVYLHLIDSQTIEMNSGNGACPSVFPMPGATRYNR